MGQKVNPHGLRVGVIQDWNAKWIADKKNFAAYIKEDDTIRTFLKNKYYQASVSKIVIERSEGKVIVDIHTGRPGVLIGKAGAGAEEIKAEIAKIVGDKAVTLNIIEVKRPDMDAQLVAEAIAAQLEKRVPSAEQCVSAWVAQPAAVQRESRQWFPVVLTAPKSQDANNTTKAAFLFTRCVPTSITALPRLIRPSA